MISKMLSMATFYSSGNSVRSKILCNQMADNRNVPENLDITQVL